MKLQLLEGAPVPGTRRVARSALLCWGKLLEGRVWPLSFVQGAGSKVLEHSGPAASSPGARGSFLSTCPATERTLLAELWLPGTFWKGPPGAPLSPGGSAVTFCCGALVAVLACPGQECYFLLAILLFLVANMS